MVFFFKSALLRMKKSFVIKVRSYKLFLFFFLIFSSHFYAQNSTAKYRQIQEAMEKNPDSAIVIAKKFLSVMKDKIDRANVCIEISQSYSLLGNRNMAISYARKANEEALQTNDNELIPRTFALLANMYRNISLFSKAKAELKNGLAFLKKTPQESSNLWIETALLREYGVILQEEVKIDSSIIYSHKALQPIVAVLKSGNGNDYEREKIYESIIYIDLGESYLKKNVLDSTEYYSSKIIENVSGTLYGDYYVKIAKLKLSLVYYKKKQYQKSLDTLKSIEKTVRDDEYPVKAELYGYFVQNYKAINDAKNFEKYNTLYQNVTNKLSEEDKKAVELVLRELDKEYQNEINKRKLYRNFIIGGALLSVLTIGFMVFYYSKKRKSAQKQYQEYIATLEASHETKESPSIFSKIKESLKISNELEQNILAGLQKFENTEKYIDNTITLASLAGKLKTNTKYLSEIIKKHKEQNYNSYINNLRIKYICNKITDNPEYRKYKIAFLATQCGFSSVDTFSKVFKNITGILPSVFIENASKNDANNNKSHL